jgi:hypothetical protein
VGVASDVERPAEGESAGRRHGRLGAVLSLAVAGATLVAFLPAFHAGFSDFDDHGFLLEVSGWRGLAPENLAWMARTMRLGHYQPLTYLSYALEYVLFGLDARAYHATNMLLHSANAVLVLWLFVRVIALAGLPVPRRAALWGAAGAALLWAVHPLRVETVAWITERRDVLSTLLLLGAAHAYLASARPGEARIGSRRAYLASVGLLLLSLLAKAWGITFVAAALVLDWFPLRRISAGAIARGPGRRVLTQKAPFAVLGAVFAVVAAIAVRTAAPDAMKTLSQWGVPERLAQACYGLVFYVRKTVAPTRLAALYERPGRVRWREPRWMIAAAAVALAGAVLAVLAARGRARGTVAAAALYIIIVSPVLGLAQGGIQLVADRYAYVSTIPLFGLVAGGLALAIVRLRSRWALAPAAAAACGCVLGVLTVRQAGLWADTRVLMEHALRVGQDGPILRNMYARQLERAGKPGEAAEQYRLSLEMKPDYGDSWFGLGNSRKALGELADAEAAFKKSAGLADDPTKDYLALGLLYIQRMDRPRDAVEAFTRAVEASEARGNPARSGTPYLMLAGACDAVEDYAQEARWLREAAKYADTRDEALGHLRDLGAR